MARTGPAYPLEYRRQIVELVRAGRSPRELEPSYETIRSWVKQADRHEGRTLYGPTSEEKEELRGLGREPFVPSILRFCALDNRRPKSSSFPCLGSLCGPWEAPSSTSSSGSWAKPTTSID